MKSRKEDDTESVQQSSWNDCHIDVWFTISKYLRPEDTLVFGLICKKTNFVTNSEAFWNGIFNRFIRSKYPWLDRPGVTDGSSELTLMKLNYF